MKSCILNESKICNDCGNCNVCDLDPNKICDNCCKCIEDNGKEYNELNLSDYLNRTDKTEILSDTEYKEWSLENAHYEPSDFLEKIDPKLLSEWEAKLHEEELKELRSKIKTLPISNARKRNK